MAISRNENVWTNAIYAILTEEKNAKKMYAL